MSLFLMNMVPNSKGNFIIDQLIRHLKCPIFVTFYTFFTILYYNE